MSSIPFLSDQPRHYVTLTASNSNDTLGLYYAYYPLTVSYLTALTIVTSNASTLYAIDTLGNRYNVGGTSPSDSQRALLLGQSYYHSLSFVSQCAAADNVKSGLCKVTLVLADRLNATVYYSVYNATSVQYSTAYSNTGVSGSLTYYARYVQSADLNVLFDLSWLDPSNSGGGNQLPLYTVMLLSSEHTPFQLLYPAASSNVSDIDHHSDQSYVAAPTSNGFSPGQVIIGLWYNSTMYPSSNLVLTPSYTLASADGASTIGYTTVLSVMALILSSAVASIILFRVCIMFRRRRSAQETISRAEVAIFEQPATAQPALPVQLSQRQHGASEAEIAALPEMVYVRSMAVDGDEADDPRCTICLDEYEPSVSHITTLRCGHTFHSTCVHSWLRQRRYCPLCLQIIDRAHDVKKERRHSHPDLPLPPAVQLADLSHTGYSTASAAPTVDYSFSRPTTVAISEAGSSRPFTESGVLMRHWDDEDVQSRSALTSDHRTSSRASLASPSTVSRM